MIKTIDVETLVKISVEEGIPVVDVRTPAEFEHGHICGAYNIPLFTNEERVEVGTTYKQIGREEAILLGFDLTGSKWSGFIKQALEIAPGKKIAVHCWRGGMRSGAMAWALNLYGFDVYLLEGGYKRYRKWVLDHFSKTYEMIILGGLTGSGKTLVLKQLQSLGEQVIDLEELAQHQGSSFGSMGSLVQPSQEQFENNLAAELQRLDPARPVWLEDESQTIGKRFVPKPFWLQIRDALLIKMQVPRERRVEYLAEEYGKLDKEFLEECTTRIWKRLGPEQTRDAVAAIREGRMEDFISIVLVYYDKTYNTGLSRRAGEKIWEVVCGDCRAEINALKILEFAQEKFRPLALANSHESRQY